MWLRICQVRLVLAGFVPGPHELGVMERAARVRARADTDGEAQALGIQQASPWTG